MSQKIKILESKKIWISAHATMRWLQRVKKLDIRQLKRMSRANGYGKTDNGLVQYIKEKQPELIREMEAQLLTPMVQMAADLNILRVPMPGGFDIILTQHVVTTVIVDDGRKPKSKAAQYKEA